MLYVWYLKQRGDWNAIHEENGIIETSEEVASVKKQLKQGKHTCLVMRTEYPRAYEPQDSLLTQKSGFFIVSGHLWTS